MIVISHRGYWREPAEKNSRVAFERSFDLGFGTETDIRDITGHLVISHDPPSAGAMTLDEFFGVLGGRKLPLALNVKADGLARGIRDQLDAAECETAFVFDMSVPDVRGYFGAGVPVYARMSEVEREPAWLERSQGIWLDGFESLWYDADLIASLLDSGRRVCVVSPELHGRDPRGCWEMLAAFAEYDALLLCTDRPEEAAMELVTSR